MSLEKIYFALYMFIKAKEKNFLKRYICLSSCHLTSTGKPAHLAGMNGAVQLGPQNDITGFQKFLLPLFSPYSQSKIYFFQRHVLPVPFQSLNSRCALNWELHYLNHFLDTTPCNNKMNRSEELRFNSGLNAMKKNKKAWY